MEVRMWDGGERQQRLFDDERRHQVRELNEATQQELTRLLVAWMRAMAKKMNTEASNEQDKR
jgi:hypothetical protein